MADRNASDPLPVARARAGCPDAWEALFRRYQLPLYAYVFEMIRNEQTSLDIVQDTFISATRHLSGLRADGKFGSWLFAIAHQKCLQAWRRHGRDDQIQEALAVEDPDAVERPDARLLQIEDEAAFLEGLARLPAPQRAVLLLHYLEDFSLETIAGITGTPVGTVKSRLHHARRALRALLASPPEFAPQVPTVDRIRP